MAKNLLSLSSRKSTRKFERELGEFRTEVKVKFTLG